MGANFPDWTSEQLGIIRKMARASATAEQISAACPVNGITLSPDSVRTRLKKYSIKLSVKPSAWEGTSKMSTGKEHRNPKPKKVASNG